MDMSAESSNYIISQTGGKSKDQYTDTLRNSSYALLSSNNPTPAPMDQQPAAAMAVSQRFSHYQSYSRQSTYSSAGGGGAVSLPYMSRSISVDSYSAENRQQQQLLMVRLKRLLFLVSFLLSTLLLVVLLLLCW